MVLWVLTFPVGCSGLFRQPVEPSPYGRPVEEALLAGMSPFYLTNALSKRVVIEVDWVEGLEPDEAALEGLRDAVKTYAAPDKEIELVVSDAIPSTEWDGAADDIVRKAVLPLAFLDHDPRAWGKEELLYVLYAPGRPNVDAWSHAVGSESDGEPVLVRAIVVFPENLRGKGQLWVTDGKLERAILVHELGHVLGLVSNPEHRAKGNPVHCTEARCVMTYPTGSTNLFNAFPTLFTGKPPSDYCHRCRADIDIVKEIWSQRSIEDPCFDEKLRVARQVHALRERARWYELQKRWDVATEMRREAEFLDEQTVCPAPKTGRDGNS